MIGMKLGLMGFIALVVVSDKVTVFEGTWCFLPLVNLSAVIIQAVQRGSSLESTRPARTHNFTFFKVVGKILKRNCS